MVSFNGDFSQRTDITRKNRWSAKRSICIKKSVYILIWKVSGGETSWKKTFIAIKEKKKTATLEQKITGKARFKISQLLRTCLNSASTPLINNTLHNFRGEKKWWEKDCRGKRYRRTHDEEMEELSMVSFSSKFCPCYFVLINTSLLKPLCDVKC